ncbi:aminodeoxychorismate synthase component I [Sinimarinibacterium sp. CAU 1509]|uniref:aminodeoxychorismate synthase component I n=1 Tax=Sinimarinibacterium sp. CAU 1509 TaxID=2562283 RepID=UPI0010ACD016|nr:aminodeoxychorismate synthase component I [Sinimarinibacterium sp. CAU 1509]TJY55770.1 aminodeoxychorismate synthase component I [Sinimarinibacterium sp. CAU 1509]
MWRAQLPAGPDLLVLHERFPQRYPLLLESVAGHPQSGRWDILFADPGEVLVGRNGRLSGAGVNRATDNFFDVLDRLVALQPGVERVEDLPFCGGWFFLLGYEAAHWVEPQLRLPQNPSRLPDALAVRSYAAIMHDRSTGQLHLLSERSEQVLAQMREDLLNAEDFEVAPRASALAVHEQDARAFEDGVRRILAWLSAGDTFQINLSRRWDATLAREVQPGHLYRQLRQSNPAPFAGLLQWDGAAVISSSPERLLQLAEGWAQTRPIAGTRRRSADAAEDAQLRAVLIANLKERAEHVMLIDLERNDLGRVCEPGSIEVSELMALESYAHVHHIVSNVRGRLRSGVGPAAALRAVFPGGTITGCPKVRAMQIIAELEGEGRGAYTGSLGYLSRDGQLDSNILIRSLIWEPGRVYFRAGAGIVADSEPGAELEETRAKARGMLLALEPVQ